MFTLNGCQLQIDRGKIWVNGPDGRCKVRLQLDPEKMPGLLPEAYIGKNPDFMLDVRVTDAFISCK